MNCFHTSLFRITLILMLCLGLSACKPKNTSEKNGPLQVVVTTTMLADMLQSIAGEHIQLTCLMGPETDPHLYKASASDLAKLQKADLIFYNGLHLEGRMDDLFSRMKAQGRPIFAITDTIPEEQLLAPANFQHHPDPHVWLAPELWALGIDTVVNALVEYDISHRAHYQAEGEALKERYYALDAWAKNTLTALPIKQRILVTSHDAFNYFGRAYDFQVIGVQGVSTASEAGLADITHTIDFIKQHNVKSIFVETSVPHATIERIAADSGAQIGGELFSDALGTLGKLETGLNGETYDLGTYEGMIKHNINTLLKALL